MSSSQEATRAVGHSAVFAGLLIVASWIIGARNVTASLAPLSNADAETVAALTRLVWGLALFGSTVTMLALYGLAGHMKKIARGIDAANADRAEALAMWDALAGVDRDPLLTLAPDGTIMAATRHIAGIAPEQLAGRALFDFIPHEHAHVVRSRLDEAATTRRPATFELRGAGILGDYGWTEHRLAPAYDKTGGTVILMTARDLTPIRRMEMELAERYATSPTTISSASTINNIPHQSSRKRSATKKTSRKKSPA